MAAPLFSEITLWTCDLAADTLVSGLSREEVRRAESLHNPLLRTRYERTRFHVRRVLATSLGCLPAEVAIVASAAGKPRLAEARGWEFSLSHSEDLLVVAVGGRSIGVDVERRRLNSDFAALAVRFFSPEDARVIGNAALRDRGELFIRQWVAKEAALKAAGCGLANALAVARCTGSEQGISGVAWEGKHYSVRPFTLADGTPGAISWEGTDEVALRWRDAGEDFREAG